MISLRKQLITSMVIYMTMSTYLIGRIELMTARYRSMKHMKRMSTMECMCMREWVNQQRITQLARYIHVISMSTIGTQNCPQKPHETPNQACWVNIDWGHEKQTFNAYKYHIYKHMFVCMQNAYTFQRRITTVTAQMQQRQWTASVDVPQSTNSRQSLENWISACQ